MTMKSIFNILVIVVALLAISACVGIVGKSANSSHGNQSVGDSGPDTTTNTVVGGDLIGGGANTGAGYGASVAGVGSLTAPTQDGIVARLKNGLEDNVNPRAGNFARSLTQVSSNLPQVTDPLKVTGFDQVQLLAYAACSDLTTGNTPLMQTRYGVTKAGTITAQSTALVAAGMKMLDAHLAGLASTSSSSAKVTSALQTLVQKVNVTGNNATIAFMAVCVAANTAGTAMMGM